MMLLLQAAAAVATDPALPVTNPDIHNLIDALADQAGLVFVSVYAIQFVKKSQLFPFVNANSTRMTKWLSVGTALFSGSRHPDPHPRHRRSRLARHLRHP